VSGRRELARLPVSGEADPLAATFSNAHFDTEDKENAIRAGILGRHHRSSQEILPFVITEILLTINNVRYDRLEVLSRRNAEDTVG
jgi:hypothetical protein